uniref:Uncharacterized protein n=1 Tax=Plectus sambesii TaxID=2011161 RepID=A0A914UQF4_9BILA
MIHHDEGFYSSNETLSAKSLLDSQDNLNGRTSQEEYSTLDSFNRADGKKKTYLEELLTPKGGGQLKAGKSLDSLTMQVERQQPWYDRGQIKAAISRESIANLGATRGLFESRAAAAAAEQSAATPPTYRPLNHIQRDIQYSQAKELEHRLNRSEQMSNGHHQQHNHRDVIHSNDVTPDGEHNSVMNQSGLDTQAIKQNGHHHSPKQNGSTVTTPVQSFEASFSQEQELFLLYIKANPEILSSLGIAIPGQLRQRINDMPPSMKRVELTLVSDYGTPTDSTAGSLDRRHQGRFVKNSTGSAHRMIARKMSDHTMQMTRPTPENRRPIMLVCVCNFAY